MPNHTVNPRKKRFRIDRDKSIMRVGGRRGAVKHLPDIDNRIRFWIEESQRRAIEKLKKQGTSEFNIIENYEIFNRLAMAELRRVRWQFPLGKPKPKILSHPKIPKKTISFKDPDGYVKK